MNILIVILGSIGGAFLLLFGVWFVAKPISRDQLLVKFGMKYFVLVALIMLSCTALIAWALSMHWMDNLNSENHFLRAVQFSLKMKEAKDGDLNLLSFILVMLFQVVVFEGLVLATIVGWTGNRANRYQNGEVRYRCVGVFKGILRKDHFAVVIGANEVAPSVIKNLLMHEDKKKNSLDYAHEKENRYVILQTCSEIEGVRQLLKAYLTEEEYNRVIIYSDIRYSYEGLKALHLEHASEIYVLGENTTIDGGETYHDTMNMRCVNLIADILVDPAKYRMLKTKEDDLSKLADTPENEERGKQLKAEIDAIAEKLESKKRVCKVLFEYQTTFSIFQFSDVPDKVHYAMHFIPFNRYESWARRVMVDNRALALVDDNGNKDSSYQITYTPLDGRDGIKPNDNQRVHLIVVGMSRMGVAMGTQAIFQAHYPNYVRDNSLKSRITFIDANAEQEMDFFKGRYASLFELARHRYIDAKECNDEQLNSDYEWIDPMLDVNAKWKHLSADGTNFLDVEIEFVKGELESEKVREYLRQVTADENSKVTIAICLPLSHQSVAAALYMPNEVYDNVQEIWVYQRESADIITNLEHARETNKRYENLRPFGMLYGEYIDSRTHYLKALLVNGIYAITDKKGDYYFEKLDMADKKSYKGLRDKWNNLSVALQWSNKYFADSMYQKLRCMSEKEDCRDVMARCEHNRWDVQQLLMGYMPADQTQLDLLKQLDADGNTKAYKQKKEELKHGLYHIHPNIIHYDLLDVYDSGAKDYDEKLNNGIPTILKLVDGYHCRYQ